MFLKPILIASVSMLTAAAAIGYAAAAPADCAPVSEQVTIDGKSYVFCGHTPTAQHPTNQGYDARPDSPPLTGATFDNIEAYLGIAYGTAGRWEKPKMADPATVTPERVYRGDTTPDGAQYMRADNYGTVCPQTHAFPANPTNDPDPATIAIGDENCLFLNVWRTANAENAPVMVFIHGGAFIIGSAADATYTILNADGELRFDPNAGFYNGLGLLKAATDNPADFPNGLVLVTLNYRLGALGFLYNDEMAKDVPGFHVDTPPLGNFGIMDQQLALEWVNAHIGAFGGDSTKVTIFGESAGAMSVGLHAFNTTWGGVFGDSSADNAGKRFHAAIMESNPIGLPYRGYMPRERPDLARKNLAAVNNQSCTFMVHLNSDKAAAILDDLAELPGLGYLKAVAEKIRDFSDAATCDDIPDYDRAAAYLNAVLFNLSKDRITTSTESIVRNQLDGILIGVNFLNKERDWYGLLPWTPFVGAADGSDKGSVNGGLLPSQPVLGAFASPQVTKIPFLIGTNRDEGDLFTEGLQKDLDKIGFDEAIARLVALNPTATPPTVKTGPKTGHPATAVEWLQSRQTTSVNGNPIQAYCAKHNPDTPAPDADGGGADLNLHCYNPDFSAQASTGPKLGTDGPLKGIMPTRYLTETANIRDMTSETAAIAAIGVDLVFRCGTAETAFRAGKEFAADPTSMAPYGGTPPIWMYVYSGAPVANASTFYGPKANACNNFDHSATGENPYQATCHSFEMPAVFSSLAQTPLAPADSVTAMTKDWALFAADPARFQARTGHAPWQASYDFETGTPLPGNGNGNLIGYWTAGARVDGSTPAKQLPWYGFRTTDPSNAVPAEAAANCAFWNADVVPSWRAPLD